MGSFGWRFATFVWIVCCACVVVSGAMFEDTSQNVNSDNETRGACAHVIIPSWLCRHQECCAGFDVTSRIVYDVSDECRGCGYPLPDLAVCHKHNATCPSKSVQPPLQGKPTTTRASWFFLLVLGLYYYYYHHHYQAIHRILVRKNRRHKTCAENPHPDRTPPIFSPNWQFHQTVPPSGKIMQGGQSRVVLKVPEGAVSSAQTISGAICTDVDRIGKQLNLTESLTVTSPVAEFHAGSNFRFNKPVSISLPHFLPEWWTEESVAVLEVSHDLKEGLRVRKLKPGHHLSEPTPGTYSIQGECVHVFTDHFSGYVCAVCAGKATLPPPGTLVLELWAKQKGLGEGRRSAEIRLYVWNGAQYLEEKCRREVLPVDKRVNFKGMECIDEKPLRFYTGDSSDVRLRVQMTPPVSEERDAGGWQCDDGGGEGTLYPSCADFSLEDFLPCESSQSYQLVEWRLTTRGLAAAEGSDVTCCDVMVSYVTREGRPLPNQESRLLQVELKQSMHEQGLPYSSHRSSMSLSSGDRLSEASSSLVHIGSVENMIVTNTSSERQSQESIPALDEDTSSGALLPQPRPPDPIPSDPSPQRKPPQQITAREGTTSLFAEEESRRTVFRPKSGAPPFTDHGRDSPEEGRPRVEDLLRARSSRVFGTSSSQDNSGTTLKDSSRARNDPQEERSRSDGSLPERCSSELPSRQARKELARRWQACGERRIRRKSSHQSLNLVPSAEDFRSTYDKPVRVFVEARKESS